MGEQQRCVLTSAVPSHTVFAPKPYSGVTECGRECRAKPHRVLLGLVDRSKRYGREVLESERLARDGAQNLPSTKIFPFIS